VVSLILIIVSLIIANRCYRETRHQENIPKGNVVITITMHTYKSENAVPDSIHMLNTKPGKGYTEFDDPIIIKVHENEFIESKMADALIQAIDKKATHVYIEYNTTE